MVQGKTETIVFSAYVLSFGGGGLIFWLPTTAGWAVVVGQSFKPFYISLFAKVALVVLACSRGDRDGANALEKPFRL